MAATMLEVPVRSTYGWSSDFSGIHCVSKCIALAFLGMSSVLGVVAQQGGGLHTVSPPTGGQIVYGTLENQKSQADGMIYMLRQVHGHFGDKPQIGKLIQARDGSSLAAFFTLTDKNFSHSQQGGMVMIDTVNGKMMAAVLTDDFKRFPGSEPGMVRTLMSAWHPRGNPIGAREAVVNPGGAAERAAGRQTVTYVTQKLYPATAGDHSITLDLPPMWKITGLGGGQVTAEGPNGELIGVGLIWQNMQRALTPDLFQSYVNMANLIRQRNHKPQGSFQLISQQPLPRTQFTRSNGTMAQFTVDFHDEYGPRKGNARIEAAAAGALFVTESWIPVGLYSTENAMVTKIINTARANTAVISRESEMDMERIRQQAIRNDIQTKSINDRREASNQAYESQRQAFNAAHSSSPADGRQATGNSHFDDIDAGSADMQNYILDRAVVQSTETRNYGTFSDAFADDIVKYNPDKLQITTNRQLLKNGEW